jgi:hypothetical protein
LKAERALFTDASIKQCGKWPEALISWIHDLVEEASQARPDSTIHECGGIRGADAFHRITFGWFSSQTNIDKMLK